MRLTCDFYVGPDDCAWCHLPQSEHRFRPCKQCQGDTTLPDPTDRTSRNLGLPMWAWRQTDCGCVTPDTTTGWVDRTTQKPADNRTVRSIL